MSDDGLQFRCIVRAYSASEDTYLVVSNPATLNLVADEDLPVWDTIPNSYLHEQEQPNTYDVSPYITGSGITYYGLSGNPSGITINNQGVVTVDDAPAGTYNMTCYAENSAGGATSNVFVFYVLAVLDVTHDFDTGNIGDFNFTRASAGEVIDYQADTVSLTTNEAGFVGLRKSGSSWIDEQVGYGLYQHPAYDTFAKTSAVAQFPALPGTPSVGVTNDYSGLYICVLDGDWASQEDGSTLVQFGSSATDYVAAIKNGNNLDAVCVIDGTTHTNSHTLTNTPSLTTLDLRVLKSRTDGFITWVNGDRQATAGATGTHTDRLDVISLGDNSNTIAVRVRTNTSAETEGTITGWEGWEHPVPIAVDIQPPVLEFPIDEEAPPIDPPPEWTERPEYINQTRAQYTSAMTVREGGYGFNYTDFRYASEEGISYNYLPGVYIPGERQFETEEERLEFYAFQSEHDYVTLTDQVSNYTITVIPIPEFDPLRDIGTSDGGFRRDGIRVIFEVHDAVAGEDCLLTPIAENNIGTLNDTHNLSFHYRVLPAIAYKDWDEIPNLIGFYAVDQDEKSYIEDRSSGQSGQGLRGGRNSTFTLERSYQVSFNRNFPGPQSIIHIDPRFGADNTRLLPYGPDVVNYGLRYTSACSFVMGRSAHTRADGRYYNEPDGHSVGLRYDFSSPRSGDLSIVIPDWRWYADDVGTIIHILDNSGNTYVRVRTSGGIYHLDVGGASEATTWTVEPSDPQVVILTITNETVSLYAPTMPDLEAWDDEPHTMTNGHTNKTIDSISFLANNDDDATDTINGLFGLASISGTALQPAVFPDICHLVKEYLFDRGSAQNAISPHKHFHRENYYGD